MGGTLGHLLRPQVPAEIYTVRSSDVKPTANGAVFKIPILYMQSYKDTICIKRRDLFNGFALSIIYHKNTRKY